MKKTQGIFVNTKATVLEIKNMFRRKCGTLTFGSTAWLEAKVFLICLLISIAPEQGGKFTALPCLWQRSCFTLSTYSYYMGEHQSEATAEPSYLGSCLDSNCIQQVGSDKFQQTPETRCFMDLEHLLYDSNFLPSSGNQRLQCASLINYWFKNLRG